MLYCNIMFNNIFSMILCWLLISLVSAHFGNETIYGKNKLNISMVPAMAISTRNPVGKDCALEMTASEIKEIIQLTKSDTVNIVDLRPSFGKTYKDHSSRDFQILLVNPIGREIIRTLDTEFSGFGTWTLNAARKKYELRIRDNPRDCINRKQQGIYDFIASSIYDRILRGMKEPTNYKICYRFPQRASPSGSFNRLCIPDDSTTKRYWRGSLVVATYIMLVVFMIYFLWLLFSLLSYSLFDIKYPQYYKLSESLVSPSSILLEFVWVEKCTCVSFFRRITIMGFLTFITWYFSLPSVSQYTRWLVLYAAVSISFSRLLSATKLSASKLETSANERVIENTEQDISCSIHCNQFGGYVRMLTLTFNLKFWKELIVDFYGEVCPERGSSKPVLNVLKKVVIFLFCGCVLFPCVIIIQPIFFVGHIFNILMLLFQLHGYGHTDTEDKQSRAKELLISLNNGLTVLSLVVLIANSLYILAFSIQSFLLGIFLNLNYFIPYLASVSVLTFYCHSSWKSMEEKYFVLKRVVYDACRDRQDDGHEIPRSPEPKQDETAVPVVSKKIYGVIREKFLPYHTNIFYFFLKVLCAFAFSYGMFEVVNMLHSFHITAAVQVVATAWVGVMPHIFSIVALKISEKRDKAWNEKLEINVKHIVRSLTVEKPELAQTVVIVQERDDVVAENVKLLKRLIKRPPPDVVERIPQEMETLNNNDEALLEPQEVVEYETSFIK